MQQIERYGVIALVFLLVTIVAVSFWGDSKSPGFWSRLTGKSDGKKEQTDKTAALDPLADRGVIDPNVPLTDQPLVLTQPTGPILIDGNQPTPADQPPMPGTNPFAPAPNDTLAGTTVPAPAYRPELQPVPQPPAQPTGTLQYVVQSGDSLAKIARQKLGAESRWVEIQSLNGGLEPRNLRVGKTILLPAGGAVSNTVANVTRPRADPTPAPKQTQPATSGGSIYIVKKGDGLRAIARRELGDESRWTEILAANPGLKADRIHPGDKLKMPSSARKSSTGSASGSAAPTSSALASAPRSSGGKPQVR
jgi:nucleoid-associated protein YgaU